MKTVSILKLSDFDEENKFVSLGKLSQDMIDFIVKKRPEYKNILSCDKDILFWKDRIAHTELHRDDFLSDMEYEKCFSEIPSIISEPNYISIHPKNGSISFIKEYSGHISVAVRISPDGKMAYRTMYPVMDAQLTHYIDEGHAWKYEP